MVSSICICGGGSLGLVCAGIFLSKGIKVNILTGHPAQWHKNISVFDPYGKCYSGSLESISDNPADVIPQSDLILLCLPGYLIENTVVKIKPYLNPNIILGSIVSSTGFFFVTHRILSKEITTFGFQRVPYIARQKVYGHIGNLLGYKASINVAIENSYNPESLRKELEDLFLTPVNLLNDFYEASLTNSNPILHTGRLFSMWKDYNGEVLTSQPKFYADWTDEASEYLIKMDKEFQCLLRILNIKESVIPTLLEYYESTDAASLTKKLRSISAFKSLLSPMKKVENGWIPDFNSRYFTEDFPYGLNIIRELSHEKGIKTPTIDEVYEWGIKFCNK